MNAIKVKIKEALLDSQKVYLLGYGYDTLNNKILFHGLPSDWSKFCKVYTTNIGLKATDRSAIATDIGFSPKYLVGTQQSPEVNCMQLLKEFAPMDKPPEDKSSVSVIKR